MANNDNGAGTVVVAFVLVAITGAAVALLMALCDRRFSATQYALFSALDSVGRIFIGPVAGVVAADWGWTTYFVISLACALPGLALLWSLRPRFALLESAAPPA